MADYCPKKEAKMMSTKIPGRLTVYDRDDIRAGFKNGMSIEQLCREYGRKKATIVSIIKSVDVVEPNYDISELASPTFERHEEPKRYA